MPLYDILNEFQKGHSHIAVVYKDLNDTKESPKKAEDGKYFKMKYKLANQKALLFHFAFKVTV